VVLTPLDDLLQDGLVNLNEMSVSDFRFKTAVDTHVRNGDSVPAITQVLEHVLDQDRALSNRTPFMESISKSS
jgi:hypothetical protein